MSIRTFALIYGLLFTALGIVGFIPAVITPYRGFEQDLWFQQGAGHNVAAVGISELRPGRMDGRFAQHERRVLPPLGPH